MKVISIQPRTVILIIIFLLLASYSIFQARAYILGPQIWIDSPRDGEAVSNPLILIQGRSKNIAWISLNGRQIFTDKDGKWSEKMLVSSGISTMTVEARDHFGREAKEEITIVFNQ